MTNAEIDQTATALTDTLHTAWQKATQSITLSNKPKSILNILDNLLNKIKLKRKVRRQLAKQPSENLRKILNMLLRKIKVEINQLKENNLELRFTQPTSC